MRVRFMLPVAVLAAASLLPRPATAELVCVKIVIVPGLPGEQQVGTCVLPGMSTCNALGPLLGLVFVELCTPKPVGSHVRAVDEP